MNNNAFWAFFTVAIIAGFAIGMVFTGGITGQFTQAVSSTTSSTSEFGDSDGINYAVQGTCFGPAGTFQDFCDGPVLHEFGWTGVSCNEIVVNCALSTFYKGCEVGRCVNGEVTPTPAVRQIAPVVGTLVPVAPVGATSGGAATTTGELQQPFPTGTIGTEPSVECTTASAFSTTTASSVMSSFEALQTTLFSQTGMVFVFAGQQPFVDVSGTRAWFLTTEMNGEDPIVSGKTKCFVCSNGQFHIAPFGVYCTGGGSPLVQNIEIGFYTTPFN